MIFCCFNPQRTDLVASQQVEPPRGLHGAFESKGVEWPTLQLGLCLHSGAEQEGREWLSLSSSILWPMPFMSCGPARCVGWIMHLTPEQEIKDVVLNTERNSATEIQMWKMKVGMTWKKERWQSQGLAVGRCDQHDQRMRVEDKGQLMGLSCSAGWSKKICGSLWLKGTAGFCIHNR